MGSVKKNYVYNTAYQILKVITPLITTPYISRILGADGVGIYSYIAAIVSNFVLFASLGTGTYGQREIAYLQDNRQERSKVFWEIEILSLLSVLITLLVYLGFALTKNENKFIYLICLLQILTIAFDVGWLFSGMEDFFKIVVRDSIFKILNIVGIFCFVNSKSDLWVYALILSALPFLSQLSLWFSIHKYVDFVPLKSLHPLAHIKGTVSLFLPTIAVQIYSVMDKVMLGAIGGNFFDNGYYEQSHKLVQIILALVASLGTVLIPRLGFYYSQNNKDKIKDVIEKSFNYIWFISIPIFFGIVAVSSNLVPWFFGDDYLPMVPLLNILSVQVIIVGLNNITGMQVLVPSKRQKIYTITVCIGMVLNLILNFLLIPGYGSKGAAVASVCAEIAVLITEIYAIRHEFNFKYILLTSRNYFVAGVLMFIAVKVVGNYMESGIIETFILVGIGGLIYFMLLTIIKDKFFYNEVLVSLRRKIKNENKKS